MRSRIGRAALIFCSLFLSAQGSQAGAELPLPLPGHNLFTTTYVLANGAASAGLYYAGRGFGDVAMLATSPWIWLNYNMINAEMKLGVPIGEGGDRASLEALGFKSFRVSWAGYVQESAFLRSTFSHPFSRGYTVHLGFGYQYFWNDEAAYSLRPLPWNADRYTLSLGALHEIDLSDRSGIFLETGILGLNYRLPFWHVGLSYHRRYEWGYLQVGLSVSGRRAGHVPPEPSVEGDYAAYDEWRRTYVDDPYSDYYVQWTDSLDRVPIHWRRFFFHPEIQFQFPL